MRICALVSNQQELNLNYVLIGVIDQTKLFFCSGNDTQIKSLSGKDVIKIKHNTRQINRINKLLNQYGFNPVSKEQSLDEIVAHLISVFAPGKSILDFYVMDIIED